MVEFGLDTTNQSFAIFCDFALGFRWVRAKVIFRYTTNEMFEIFLDCGLEMWILSDVIGRQDMVDQYVTIFCCVSFSITGRTFQMCIS